MLQATLPLALQIVIDDVGWWCGEDTHAANGPYRSGNPRPHLPTDYQAIVDLGRRLNMRPQAAIILGEWDRTNFLRDLPSSQWQGAAWDNSQWVGPWLDEAAEIITGNPDHFELTLHGVGHEYWTDGVMSRAEWHDREGQMRPREQVERHLDAFAELLAQNGLGAFPESFVPAAFLHRFGSEAGLASLLAPRGIKYFSTPYGGMFRDRDTEEVDFGVDHGVLTLDRGRDLNNWNVVAPEVAGDVEGAIVGMHWPNVLHPDAARNGEVVERWVQVLEPYHRRPDRILGRDTAEAFSQLVYHRWGSLTVEGNTVQVDLRRVAALAAPGLLDSFHLKIIGAGEGALTAEGFTVVEDSPVPGAPEQRLVRLRREAGRWEGAVRFGG